jgi:predicted RNA-binding protein with PIN domain
MTVFYSKAVHLFVDGMNVIGSRPDGWWRDREGAMRALAEKLAAYSRASGDAVTVVFDARPFEIDIPSEASLEIGFAHPGPDAADDELVRRIEALDDPADAAIVTSDDELARRAAALGVRILSSGSFRRELDAFEKGS